MKTFKKVSTKEQSTNIIFPGWISPFLVWRNVIFRSIFREKIIFAFLTGGSFHICRKKKYHFYQHTENIIFPWSFWEIFSFIFCLWKNIIFSEKGSVIFPPDIRKIIFQWNVFWKDYFLNIWRIYHISIQNVFFLFFSFCFFFFFFGKGLSFIFHLKNNTIFSGNKSIFRAV